ncbi:hypothetical protein AN958_10396 [Leucoagaricus sp. SymC.cos]|nr:hypothetical protein AN958_10396 [Leucoagaricus sp. SymC.cos]
MSPSSSSQKPGRNPAISSGVKRARPRGLWKARGSGPRLSTPLPAPTPKAPREHLHQRIPSESGSDSDRVSCSSSILSSQCRRSQSGSDTPLSTDLEDTLHGRTLVTKHQSQPHHLRQDYFSAIPQPGDDSSDDSTNWTTRTKIMDVSTTAGSGDPSPAESVFTYEDWLDLKQLFVKACEQYELDDPAETLPLLRGVIHECHRCLLAYHDPSMLFTTPQALAAQTKISREPGPTASTDLPSSFHTLLGTTLFFFANSIAANPELALPGEPSTPVPYWIAALDVFETGENLPSRVEMYSPSSGYRLETQPRTLPPPPREDWRMAVMWGRTLVALATEMVDRHRGDPPPEPQFFPSPFPTNRDYLKTGTIWDDEPEWPLESPFGVIIARRPPITRRMTLNGATPHEILQLAMDHFSRGIFHMPHHTRSSTPPDPHPSRPVTTPPFTRSKSLYEIADEVLLLAEKLENPEERKEWAVYADSVFAQIHASQPHKHQEQPASSSRDTGEVRPGVGEGLVAKARGRTCLVIGSTIAEIIEERMDQGSENEEAIGSLMQSEDAEEARDHLLRAIEYFERAKSYIADDTLFQQEAEEERSQISHLLAESLCSLANLTEDREQQEDFYRRAEAETDDKLFDDEDEEMDEGH